MKHFYFVTETLKRSKKYGCSDIRCKIYKLEKGQPIYIAFTDYNTASTRGAINEVFAKLMEIGLIPKKYENSSKTDWCGSGYFYGEVTKKYGIWELY